MSCPEWQRRKHFARVWLKGLWHNVHEMRTFINFHETKAFTTFIKPKQTVSTLCTSALEVETSPVGAFRWRREASEQQHLRAKIKPRRFYHSASQGDFHWQVNIQDFYLPSMHKLEQFMHVGIPARGLFCCSHRCPGFSAWERDNHIGNIFFFLSLSLSFSYTREADPANTGKLSV